MLQDLQPAPMTDEEAAALAAQQPTAYTNQSPGGAASAPDPAMDAYAQQLAAQSRADAAFAPTKAEVQTMAGAAGQPAPATPPQAPTPTATTAAPVSAGPLPGATQAPMAPRPQPMFVQQVSPGGVIPGHEVDRVGETGKRSIASTIDANNQYAQAASDASIDKQLANEEFQAVSLEHRKALAEQTAQIQKDQAEYRAKADQLQAEIDSDTRRLSNLKVDPDRWWKSKSDFQLMGMKVGQILGGFLEGYTKGAVKDNSYAKMRAEIDADVASQEAAYNRLQNTIAAKRSSFGQLVQRYGSPEAAKSALTAIQLRQMDSVAQSAASKIGTADAKMRAAEISRNVDAENAKLRADAVAYMMPKAVGPSVTAIDPVTGLRLTQEQAFKAGEAEKERRGKLDEESAKAQQKQADTQREDLKWIANERAKQGLPEQENAVSNYRTSAAKVPGDRGVGPVASRIASASPLLYEVYYGKDAGAREQAWAQIKNAYYARISGAAVSPGEEARYESMLSAAHTPEQRAEALRLIEAGIAAASANIDAGAPGAARTHNQQVGAVTGAPAGATKR